MSFSTQIGIQKVAVENTEELQFYLRDLKQWEAEIKAKDHEYLRQKGNAVDNNSEHIVVPERGAPTTSKKVQSIEKRKKTNDEKKKSKIPSYDYAAWDKFDAEKSCEDVDHEDKLYEDVDHEDKLSEDEDDDEETELLRSKQQAILEKNKGNDYLKAGKLDEAINCYTRGRQLDPFNPLLPANRALALLKKLQFGAAEADCDVTISLDPTYVKAFQRRAVARMALKKYSLARDDLMTVLRIEPNNKEAKNELTKAEQAIKSLTVTTPPTEDKNTNEVVSSNCNIGRVPIHAIHIPEHLRSKKPLQRIKVTEVSGLKVVEIPENSKFDKELNDKINSPSIATLNPLLDGTKTFEVGDIQKAPPRQPTLPSPPSSSYQFEKDYRCLKNHPELLYRYIKSIPCTKYPSLFQHSLESEVLSQMLLIYRNHYMWNGDDLYDPLWNLAQTKRFSALQLFLSDSDKLVLQELFDHMIKTTVRSDEELRELKAAYQVK